MDDIIKIKCPYCGAVLSVKKQAGIESKSVTCPICKQKSPFKDFKKIVDKPNGDGEHTQYPGSDGEKTSYQNSSSDPLTETGQSLNFTLGRLICSLASKPFQLKPGKNIIGREAHQSIADWQIPTEPRRKMSREHLIIEVKKVPGKGFVHYASLYKQRINKTYIGNELLEYGDCVVLNHGDIIKLPDAVVKFEIPDEEGTDF